MVHDGPWTGERPELAGARAHRRYGDWLLAAMARGARGRCGEPADGLTWGGEAVRRASSGGERNPTAAVGVKVLRERR
jgi:hypothetical protein